jgi:hypothetical protein
MTELFNTAVVFLILLGSGVAGLYVRPLLSERHRSHETFELVRLVVTMLVTFAALVLGLLTTSVKSSFDTVNTDLRSMATDLIQLDQAMRAYGPETDGARALLRRYAAEAIATTWPGEPPPPGIVDPLPAPRIKARSQIESVALGDMLTRIDTMLRDLQPADAMHRRLVSSCLTLSERLSQRRWKLIEEAQGSISMPFYVVMVFWLVVVFASFGLSAPRNLLVFVMLGLSALSIASAVFVILDLDAPFTGIFSVSSEPLREAFDHLSR